ncbi:MAG TPA: hypothetical protein PKA10_00565 [Selenomonadales bacterium]|nr:hypothetical protein [Selenomonadales bacterium]
MKDRDGYLAVIDVGANIGDSACLISQAVAGSFLCIEGNGDYFSLLQDNTKRLKGHFACVNAVCAGIPSPFAGEHRRDSWRIQPGQTC